MPPVNNNAAAAAAAAAAAEARRRAAEEARRRAEAAKKAQEAAKKAAEAQKKAAAEQKKKAAEAQKKKAQDAQQKAKADVKEAKEAKAKAEAAKAKQEEAKKKAEEAQQEVAAKQRIAEMKGPKVSEQERKELDEAQKTARKLNGRAANANQQAEEAQQEADKASAQAAESRKAAIDEANKAIKTQKEANVAAKEAGEPEPFEAANRVRDAYDAGSLDANAQEKLFGTKSVVSAQEAARSDAKAVSEATERSPAEGAKELRRQLDANNDLAYRDTLMKESKGNIDKMTSSLGSDDVSQEQANQIVRDLGHSADLTSPEASRQVADSFRRAEGSEETGSAAESKINNALKAGSDDPAVARIAKGMADGFRVEGQYDKADAITRLDPNLEKTAAQSTGETRARDAVAIEDAGERKDVIAQQQKQTDADTRAEVDNLFDAAKNNKPPEGFEAVKTDDPNRVEFVQKNKQGDVTARISATKGEDDQVTLDTSSIGKDGRATRDVVSTTGPEGTTTSQHAEWKPARGEKLDTPPSIDTLKNSRDPSVTVQEDSVRRDGENIVTSNYRQAEGGVEGSETTFSQQDGEDGLDDNFKDKFNGDEPIDRIETRTYSIPPPGTKGPDGKEATPTYTRTQTYSQGEGTTGVQATSTASKKLEGDGFGVDGGPRNAADLAHVRESLRAEDGEDGEEFDGNEDSPKQWTLETTNGNKYASQTFVEGHEDASIITRREAKGSTVTEEVEGKTFSTQEGKEGELVDVSSKSSRTYNEQGIVSSAHAEATGADGVKTVQDYKRTEKKGPNGQLQVDERSTSTQTPPDGPTTSATMEQTSRQAENGQMQLFSASQTVTGPGGTAKASVNPDGSELTINGSRIETKDQLAALPNKEAAFLGASAQDALSQQVHNFAALTPEVANPAATDGDPKKKDTGPLPKELGDAKQGVSTTQGALGLLQQKALVPNNGNAVGPPTDPNAKALTQTGRFSANGLGVAASGIGALTSGVGFVTNLQQGNYVQAAKNAAETAVGVGNIYQGVKGFTGLPEYKSGIVGAGNGVGGVAGLKGAFTSASGFRSALAAGGKLGVAGTALGVVSGGLDVVGGIKSGDGWQIAKGGVSIAGAIGAGVAVGAIGGPAGAAVGLAIGVGVYAVGKVFDMFSDKEHQIADVKI
jgi:hypothetical protein